MATELPNTDDKNGIGNSSTGTWKLPSGIEDHMEDAIIKITAGVLVGGAVGMILFRSGGGRRSMSIASGVGVAMGSSYVRFMASANSRTLNSVNTQTTTANDVTVQLSPVTPFDAKPVPLAGGGSSVAKTQSRSA